MKYTFSTDYWQKTESLLEFYPLESLDGSIPVSAVKLFDSTDDGLLLVSTPKGWDIPGGHVEPGETPVEALIRETEEETGGIPVDYRLAGILKITTTKENEYNKKYPKVSAIAMYRGRIENSTQDASTLRHESTEVKRFSRELLPELLPFWSQLNQEILDYVETLN